ncbi:hypothetical protein CEXT_486961 [Caerostris extrusa]|uniref:Uncharacterized protein n=1 Tax=Caerostris extrusa TaxID=172846 RepID=A0AAV4S3D6_CAEEX|nr:hypothetical protein CEXT_486961 [Caerostris extrusa]
MHIAETDGSDTSTAFATKDTYLSCQGFVEVDPTMESPKMTSLGWIDARLNLNTGFSWNTQVTQNLLSSAKHLRLKCIRKENVR